MVHFGFHLRLLPHSGIHLHNHRQLNPFILQIRTKRTDAPKRIQKDKSVFGASRSPFDLVLGKYNPPQAMSRRSAVRWAKVAPPLKNTKQKRSDKQPADAFDADVVSRKQFVVDPQNHQSKLIKFMQKAAGLDRLQALRKIADRMVWISGSSHAPFVDVRAGGVLHAGDIVNIAFRSRKLSKEKLSTSSTLPSKSESALQDAADEIKSRILYKDDHTCAINKPHGLASQGGSGMGEVHLDNIMPLVESDPSKKPRLVHRLDKNTSGVMLFARTLESARRLSELIQKPGMVITKYVAIVEPIPTQNSDGESIGANAYLGAVARASCVDQMPTLADLALRDHATITTGIVSNGMPSPKERMCTVEWFDSDNQERRSPLGDPIRKAVTQVHVLERTPSGAFVLQLEPVTGRKHQLRLHCADVLRAGILGDHKYAHGVSANLARKLHVADPNKMHMHLHLYQMVVRDYYGEGCGDLQIVAGLPKHMQKTFKTIGVDSAAVLRKIREQPIESVSDNLNYQLE